MTPFSGFLCPGGSHSSMQNGCDVPLLTIRGQLTASDVMSKPSRNEVIVTVIVLLIFILPPAFFWVYSILYFKSATNFYSVTCAEDVLREYRMNHPGELPKGWDELSDAFDTVNETYGYSTIDELRTYVTIDFEALAAGCPDDDSPTPLFIRGRTFSKPRSVEIEANNRIRKQLLYKRSKVPAQLPEPIESGAQ